MVQRKSARGSTFFRRQKKRTLKEPFETHKEKDKAKESDKGKEYDEENENRVSNYNLSIRLEGELKSKFNSRIVTSCSLGMTPELIKIFEQNSSKSYTELKEWIFTHFEKEIKLRPKKKINIEEAVCCLLSNSD